MEEHKVEVYTDGGLMKGNPSPIGGMWAYVHIVGGKIDKCGSGIVLASGNHQTECPVECLETDAPTIGNNWMEMFAVVQAIRALPPELPDLRRKITLLSDSKVTIGRLSLGWALNGIPDDLQAEIKSEIIPVLGGAEMVNLSGHPKRRNIARGVGDSGRPVSIHNVWCDSECKRVAKLYLDSIG